MKNSPKKIQKSALKPDTLCIHGGISEDENTGAVNIPIYQASTFRMLEMGKHKGFEYGRTGNPTRKALENLIADLENGCAGFAFSSGMAALTTILMLFKTGDKILIARDVYGGTLRLANQIFNNFNLTFEAVDFSDFPAIKDKIAADPQIKGLIFETPANPLLGISDIAAISEIAKKRNILTIIDNTFMSPYWQKPLDLGADIVIHSASKYLGGHNDVIAGLIAAKDKDLAEKIGFIQNSCGTILPPFDSWLLIRGIKTLAVRLDRLSENAAFLADFLNSNDAVAKVFYPGLKDFIGHDLQKKQAKAFGAIISFRISPKYDINEFFKSLEIIAFAESLGGTESLICHPETMTHAALTQEQRDAISITGDLIRFSVGLENKDDLKEDLSWAFKQAYRAAK